ncbi:hypothetical protein N431DRAFT_563508 [Stipitochalara longipes BDJ]|nr:hypothetical protein N431DRAFT_563508 [Stipitochalara longipes BDJ]
MLPNFLPAKRKRPETAGPVDSPDVEAENKSKKPENNQKNNICQIINRQINICKESTRGKESCGTAVQEIIGDVDKKVSSLDARVRKNGPNSAAVNSDHYAGAMVRFIKDIEKLKAMGPDGVRCAFNATLYIGPHAHGDLEISYKMSGYGGTERPFADMDDTMLGIIGLRDDLDCAGKNEGVELPEVRHRWTTNDAEVGVFKTGKPNKQQRGQIERQKAKWVKERFKEARKRREKVRDWVRNAFRN